MGKKISEILKESYKGIELNCEETIEIKKIIKDTAITSMNEKLKNIIKKVIKMKEEEIVDLNFSDMTEQKMVEHSEILLKASELEEKLANMLSKEQWKVMDEFCSTLNSLNAMEQEYMFDRGVKAGLNELSFIKDELGQGVVML